MAFGRAILACILISASLVQDVHATDGSENGELI